MDSVSTYPLARKRHTCLACYGTIGPGETYERIVSFYDGTVGAWKACTDCRDITDRVLDYTPYDYDEGLTADDYDEWASENTDDPAARAYLHRREHGRPDPEGEAA